jgi:transcriptional regulator with XRE-family HTH domain
MRTIRTINTLAAEIRRRAAMHGMNMSQLAAAAGWSQSRLAHLLEGEAITERAFHRICRGLGIQPAEWDDWDELFGRKETTLQLARKLRRNVALREKNERSEKKGW